MAIQEILDEASDRLDRFGNGSQTRFFRITDLGADVPEPGIDAGLYSANFPAGYIIDSRQWNETGVFDSDTGSRIYRLEVTAIPSPSGGGLVFVEEDEEFDDEDTVELIEDEDGNKLFMPGQTASVYFNRAIGNELAQVNRDNVGKINSAATSPTVPELTPVAEQWMLVSIQSRRITQTTLRYRFRYKRAPRDSTGTQLTWTQYGATRGQVFNSTNINPVK